VFGSGRVSIRQMATAGIWMNLISIGAITLYLSVFGGWVL
jgi:di/tricarboxylate transporter